MAEHPDVYRNHLVIAHWLDGWLARTYEAQGRPLPESADFIEGFEHAVRAMAAHLRQGDLLPGGDLYEEQVRELR